ncbi:MAG: YdcF family protein [Chloroflexaceae bacterium]|nr:YdcF family protein [Chloroflexaceae bacterium]
MQATTAGRRWNWHSGIRPRHLVQPLVLLVLLLIIAVLLGVTYVVETTRGYRFTQAAAVPNERVALVFGAGVRANGQPSPMLADRLDAAVALYKQGQVQKLLMSGDNSRQDYNEVEAMRRYAVAQGVPAEAITLDYAGFSTYETCYRAQAIFGVQQAVLVTQRYHLPRAVYTCRALGVEAVGLGTSDWDRFNRVLMMRYGLRESLAILNALWEVHVSRPLPTFLGPFEGLG